jgi:hypothetical protein
MTKAAFTEQAFRLFVTFVVRNGVLSRGQALEEVEIMKSAGMDLTSDMSMTERESRYLTKQRIGASFPLTRADRKNLLLSLENAINHATFDDELVGNPDKYLMWHGGAA